MAKQGSFWKTCAKPRLVLLLIPITLIEPYPTPIDPYPTPIDPYPTLLDPCPTPIEHPPASLLSPLEHRANASRKSSSKKMRRCWGAATGVSLEASGCM